MSFRVDSAACFAGRIGETGVSEDVFSQALAALAPAVARLAAARDSGDSALLALPRGREDLPRLRELAGALGEDCDDVVVLGTGGSSLGGQAVSALAVEGSGGPRLHFLDNVDPDSFETRLAALDLARTGVIAVSKSGATLETLCQVLVVVEALTGAIDEGRLAARLVVITEDRDSPLRALAERFRLPLIDHHPDIAGRYSVLSAVGLLPALIAGLDPLALREGAAAVLDGTLAPAVLADADAAVGAAIAVGLQRQRGVSQSVLMSYADRLGTFGLWYRQLWAESLGKNGQGTTPIPARGTVDQHSQLQLYLDGPRDKMFTLLHLDSAGCGPRIPGELLDDPQLGYLAGRSLGDVLLAEAQATAESLIESARPTRVIELSGLDETVLGGLFMHFMLETILAAELLAVDPFDQPAVESGKRRARAHLAGQGRSDP
jgi:glucose-6-phosphate isomerase